jgi:RNA polymerase sigma factor (sigma-70 family)
MSNNYVKKYECGELRMDLPRANCIYELPLLSFGDMRNSVNLSLVFNRAMKEDGGNPFNISNGYKLNLQKRIIKNSDNSISYQEADGKIVDLLDGNNIVGVHTFLDHSQRIVREISLGYELEYPDFSKERYDSNGRIINTIDKFKDSLSQFDTWVYSTARSTVLNFIRTKKRYEARIVLDDELVANYISRDYTELNHTLYDLEKVLGKDMYVIYILRTAYEVTFDNIATLLDTNRENVRRKYLQSVKIVEEFLEE